MFWKFVQSIVCRYTVQKVTIDANTVIFNVFRKSREVENNCILLYLVNLGKYCIWLLRNEAKFESRKVTLSSIIYLFLAKLRCRVLTDFERWDKDKFNKFWCKNTVIAKVTSSDKVVLLLKPP